MSFSIAEIGCSKSTIFHVILLNTDISITTQHFAMKFGMPILRINCGEEGLFDLDCSLYFMLSSKLRFEIIQNVTRFLL